MSYIAFFDLDETIIKCKSMIETLRFYYRETREMKGVDMDFSIDKKLESFESSQESNRSLLNRLFYKEFKGINVDDMKFFCQRWFDEIGVDFINSKVMAEIKRHKTSGGRVIIISGSFEQCVAPIAHYVGANNFICAKLEIENGFFSGELINAPVIGVGKSEAITRLIEKESHVDLNKCFAYGDHESDIPMLALTGNPVVVGNNSELVSYGKERNWLMLN